MPSSLRLAKTGNAFSFQPHPLHQSSPDAASGRRSPHSSGRSSTSVPSSAFGSGSSGTPTLAAAVETVSLVSKPLGLLGWVRLCAHPLGGIRVNHQLRSPLNVPDSRIRVRSRRRATSAGVRAHQRRRARSKSAHALICLKNDVSFASAPRCPPPLTPSSPLAAPRAVADHIDHQGTPRRQLVTAHSGRPREAEGNEGGRDASAN